MDEKVGKLWNSFITKKVSHLYEDEQIFFTHKSRPLKLFYHILGGDKNKDIYITDKRSIKTSRTFLEQISGAGKTFHLAWQDEKGIYLPASLAYFPSEKYNEIHYYWLVAMLTHINVNQQNIVEENTTTTNILLKKYFGFGEFYKYAQKFLMQNYPQLSDSQYPNPLWVYPSMTNSGKLLDMNADDVSNTTENKQHKRDTLTMKKKADQIDDTKKTDGLLLFLPESVLSFMEQVSVDRQENDSYDEDAIYNAEELDEITLGQKDPNLSARVKMDLDIKGNELIEYPLGKGILIDEWDYKKKSYLQKYVLIKPHVTLNVEPIKLPQRLIKTMKKIQNELDLIQLERIKRNHLPYGDNININTWIDYKSDENQLNHSQKFFESYEKHTRNMSTLILADVSLSTEAGVTQEVRVIDMIRDALMVFAESLHKLKDQFSIYTFSSVKNTKVNFHIIKNFKENYNDLIRGRIEAIKPGYYTRMGAAIRESSKILEKQKSPNKLLLILSDGKPNDVDRYDGRYGIEDTKKAIDEAKKKGVIPFCITIDTDAKEYLPYLFGKNGYTLIRDPKKLPKVLPEIYMNLTKGN